MGHITDAAVSGDGLIGPFTGDNVAYMYVDILSTPEPAAVLSATTPARVTRQGWVALGVHVVGDCGGACPDGLRMRDQLWVNSMSAIIQPAAEANFADSVFYHFEPGVSAHIYVENPT